jgi:endonuclease YncB( thermonuclease family)
VDEKMITAGLAEVYRGSGAVYGSKGKEFYESLESKAKQSKKGQWSLDGAKRESAAEYKARTK